MKTITYLVVLMLSAILLCNVFGYNVQHDIKQAYMCDVYQPKNIYEEVEQKLVCKYGSLTEEEQVTLPYLLEMLNEGEY